MNLYGEVRNRGNGEDRGVSDLERGEYLAMERGMGEYFVIERKERKGGGEDGKEDENWLLNRSCCLDYASE